MTSLLRGVFVIGAKRTAFGSFGGKLKDTGAIDLCEIASRAAITQAGIDAKLIDSVTVGSIIQISDKGGAFISRTVGLRLASHDIVLRDSEIALAGAAENMSLTPFLVRNARFGVKFSQAPVMECALWETLTDHHIKTPMGITAENLAERFKISREDADKVALMSQQNWKRAHDEGRFKQEIVGIPFKNKKTGAEELFLVDEHPKPATTLDSLSKLPPAFKKTGTVTAGNASGVNDGAAAILLASEDAVKKHSLKPLARIVGYAVVGCDPHIMGIGPAGAIRKLCDRTGVSIKDIDVIEINEAFAAQFAACVKELDLDPEKTNVNGGAVALGHPVGASGGRIVANLVYELKRSNKKYAVGSACIGGGQGIAVMIENV